MSTEQFTDGADFIAACQKRSISDVIIAYRQEWGPEESDDIEYGPIKYCRLLAYDKGTVLSCDQDGMSVEDAEALLNGSFTTHRRSRKWPNSSKLRKPHVHGRLVGNTPDKLISAEQVESLRINGCDIVAAFLSLPLMMSPLSSLCRILFASQQCGQSGGGSSLPGRWSNGKSQ